LDLLTPVAVVTDSACGLPAEMLREQRIEVVPFWVQLGTESFVSGVDLHPDGFFQRLRRAPGLPVSTSVPAVARFLEVYRRLATRAKAIVSVHIAGKQSGTCNAAELAGRESPIPVVVIDTETTAMGEGFVALEAARAANLGAPLEAVAERARLVAANVGLVALLESVTYAFKGGRLGLAAGKVGSLLRIQPLIRVQRNHVSLVGQARRRDRGLESLVEKVKDEARDDPVHIAVHYAEDQNEGQKVLDVLRLRLNCVEDFLLRVPVELGVHAGPGAVGIAYYIERANLGLAQQLGKLGEQARQAILSHLPTVDRD